MRLRRRVCVARGRLASRLRRGRVRLLPARLNDGELAPVPGAHSHMLSGYAVADALMVVPAGGLSPGDGVRYIRV